MYHTDLKLVVTEQEYEIYRKREEKEEKGRKEKEGRKRKEGKGR